MADDPEALKRFGRRTPRTPAVTPPDRSATKRSQTVSTVLVAGAGIAALSLGTLDRTAPGRDVLVYPHLPACTREAIRSAEDCSAAYAVALAAYPGTAPHYESMFRCEEHHGYQRCQTDPAVVPPDPMRFVPRMAGYLLGREPADGVTPEPVYDHDGGHRGHGSHGGGYCTGSGGRVTSGSGTYASSAKLTPAATKATRFGGFGSSGRSFSSFGGT